MPPERPVSPAEEDLARLRRLLRSVTRDGEEEVRRRLRRTEELRVLDIACGDCREAEVLTDFAAEWLGGPGAAGAPKGGAAEAPPAVRLTGIDLRAREIADAARRFRGGRAKAPGDFEFLVGDASKLDAHRELGEDFHLVFLRHQNYWNGARTWEEIFDQALAKLGEDGRLVITSYFDREHAQALEAIQRLGGELVRTESNRASRALPTPGKSVDRHIAVFRRREE